MDIIELDRSHKGKAILFTYTTTHYYDVRTLAYDGVGGFQLARVPFAEPQTKQFKSSLFEDYLQEPRLFCAQEDGEWLGVAEVSRESWNNRLRVSNLWVREEWRYQGIGKLLMARVIEVARELGCRAVVLETQSFNDPAIRFYRAMGFTMDSVDLSYYANDDLANDSIAVFLKRKFISEQKFPES